MEVFIFISLSWWNGVSSGGWQARRASDCFIAQDNVGGWETGTLSWWIEVSSGRWQAWSLIALLLRIMLEDGKLELYPG
jgi:hypothetical protein